MNYIMFITFRAICIYLTFKHLKCLHHITVSEEGMAEGRLKYDISLKCVLY